MRHVRRQPTPSTPDQSMFHNTWAQQLYTENFSKRTPIIERKVNLGEIEEIILSHIFRSRKWVSLTTGLPPLSVELVKEFYSNIHAMSPDGSFDVTLRNIQIQVSPGMLADLLNAPRVTEAPYPYASTSGPNNPAIYARLYGYKNAWDGRTPIPTNKFSTDYLLLSRVVLINLYPTNHHSDVGLDRATLLYALINDVPIDLGSHLCKVILEAHQSNKIRMGLPFASLVTRITLFHSVLIPETKPRIPLKTPIDHQTIQLSRAHICRFPFDDEDHAPSSQPSRATPSGSQPSSSRPSTLAPDPNQLGIQMVLDCLSHIQTLLDHIDSRLDHIVVGLEHIDSRLDNLESHLHRIEDHLDTRIDNVDACIDGLHTHLERMDTRCESLVYRFDIMDVQFDMLQNKVLRRLNEMDEVLLTDYSEDDDGNASIVGHAAQPPPDAGH